MMKQHNEPISPTLAELQHNLEQWNQDDEYQKIIDAIEGLPSEEQLPELKSQLARAYNNLAGPQDRPLFQKAVRLLESVEEEFHEEHNWNFRMGYALYYLDQESKARDYFEKALEYRPGDEDTKELIELCNKSLTLPNSMKPFRQRVKEGWQSFLEGEAELRAMMDGGNYGDCVVEQCSRLLNPAFDQTFFEIGRGDVKYDLILSADGNISRLYKLVYFKNHAPEEVFHHWNILIGRQPANQFELRMYDQSVGTSDVRVWVEELDDKQIGLCVYCEKLLTLLKEDENQAYNLMAILLDQAIGEIAAIRYVGYMDLLEAPQEGDDLRLSELADYISSSDESRSSSVTAEELCEWYSGYQMTPQEEEWIPRGDVFTGVTKCINIVRAYYRADDAVMDDFHIDGAVPAFFYYPLDGIPRDQILDLRDRLEQEIAQKAGDAVTFTGGATGTECGYLDFIAWDLNAVLNAAVEVFEDSQLKEALFHTFRRDVGSIVLKREDT